MGIYVFKHRTGSYIKIGHYSRSNPWSRIAHRGFRTCKHPAQIKGRVMCDDMELVAWFPALVTKDEKKLHSLHRPLRAVGEWYPIDKLPVLLKYLDTLSHRLDVDTDARTAALETRRRL